MKKLFFVLALMLTGFITFGNQLQTNIEVVNSEKIEIKIENNNQDSEVTIISFNSFLNFDAFDANQLNIDEDYTVVISLTVGLNDLSTTLTANNISCDQVGATIGRLTLELKKSGLLKE